MVSAFDVYLVMQLDSIKGVMSGVVAAGIIGTGAAIIFAPLGLMAGEDLGVDIKATLKKYFPLKTIMTLWLFSLAGSAFLPSSKTMAAMILVPALTSKEVTEPLSREAGELYGLAKDALRSIAEKPKDKPAAAE